GLDDRNDIPEKFGIRFVSSLAQSLLERDSRELIRGRQRDFDVARGVLPQEIGFHLRETFLLPDALHDDSSQAGRRGSVSSLPSPDDRTIHVQAFDRLMEAAHEASAAKFAIGKDLESEFFLTAENVQDVPVLELVVLFRSQTRILVPVQQFLRPEQAADMIS